MTPGRRIGARQAAIAFTAAFVAALVGTPAASGGRDQGSVTRTIYASVTDRNGAPVVDMAAAEFEVKDGGRIQSISARLATSPLRVALIVSDWGSGQFQGGALRFCEALLGQGEISITSLIVQPERVVDFTSNADTLRGGLLQVGRRSAVNRSGAQIVEAIMEAAKTVAKEGTRPAIVVMRAGSEAFSPMRPEIMKATLRASGATMYIVSTAQTGSGMTNQDMAEGALTVLSLLNDGASESGGRHIQVLGTRTVPAMQQVAAELVNQYEITYTLPADVAPSERISVSSKRKGVSVHAPSRIAPAAAAAAR